MARAWVTDLWLTGDAPSSAKRSLNAAKNPQTAAVPERYKTRTYGRGMRWRVGWFSPDGKRHTKAVKTKTAAEELKAALEDDIRSGRYRAPADHTRTFAEAAQEFLDSKHRIKQSTRNFYEQRLRTYVLPRWADTPLVRITENEINEWINALQDGTAPYNFDSKGHPAKLSVSSIRQVVGVAFGAVLRYASESKRGWLTINPMDGVELPREHAQSDALVFLTYPEVELLADAAATQSDATLIRFLAYVGCRIGEAAALKIDDFDFDLHRVRISKTWTEGKKGEGVVLGATKTWEARTVAFPAFLDHALQSLTEGHDGDDFMFRTVTGKPINLHNWRNRVFKDSVAAAGLDIEGLTPKALRHTFASLAVASGADVKTIQKQLGHRDARMTLNVYATLFPDHLDSVMQSMDTARTKALGL